MGFAVVGKPDAGYGSKIFIRRSRTGFTMCINSPPVYWCSKKYNRVGTSSFSSEVIAMKQSCECI